MIHYSCDRCKRQMGEEEIRYIVKIDVTASINQNSDDEIDGDEQLLELQEMLDRMEDAQRKSVESDLYHQCRYDLCTSCHQTYLHNPLGIGQTLQIDFSSN